jgi:tripartite-type tricarboxylate transporter receptor subunit TctC
MKLYHGGQAIIPRLRSAMTERATYTLRVRMQHSHMIMVAASLVAGSCALAQPYPARPLRIIVHNAPSGVADFSARLVAPKLAEALGQPVIVDNRVGAGGTLGTAAAVKAPPDGFTLIVVFDSHATNPSLFKNLEYDTLNDLAAVSLLVRGPMLCVVHPSLAGVRTVREFVALAKARPGALNFATVGPGSPARLMMELLKLEARIDVTTVPYKGAALALTDLMAGEVDAMFAAISSAGAYVKAGRLRALAVTSLTPTPLAPGLPTLAQTYPGLRTEVWSGMLAPARTPPAIIARLNAELAKILAQPDLQARLAEFGLEPAGGTPAQFDGWIRAEIERWGKVIRAQKITLE